MRLQLQRVLGLHQSFSCFLKSYICSFRGFHSLESIYLFPGATHIHSCAQVDHVCTWEDTCIVRRLKAAATTNTDNVSIAACDEHRAEWKMRTPYIPPHNGQPQYKSFQKFSKATSSSFSSLRKRLTTNMQGIVSETRKN